MVEAVEVPSELSELDLVAVLLELAFVVVELVDALAELADELDEFWEAEPSSPSKPVQGSMTNFPDSGVKRN